MLSAQSTREDLIAALRRGEALPAAAVIRYAQIMIGTAVATEREACAALVDAWPDRQGYTSDRYTYAVRMATELADAIRARVR